MGRSDGRRQIHLTRRVIRRFWGKVDRGNPDDCWNWTGATWRTGRGKVRIRSGFCLAHRVSWVIHHGPIPPGRLVLHTCDNRRCVNPSHLYLGDQGNNVQDAYDRGRREPLQGEKNPRAKLRDEDILKICKLRKQGMMPREIANHFPVGPRQIFQILRGKAWVHVPRE